MNRDVRFHGQAGLSLPELLVVSFVFVTLVALVSATFRYQTMTHRREVAKVTTQTDLRIWVDRMVADIRRAGYDPCYEDGNTFTIQTASSTEITFTLDFDGDCALDADGRERVGYRLNGNVLELWRGDSSWRPVLQGMTSLVFTCLDAMRREFTCAATPDSMRRSIAAVHIAISAEAETGGVPTVAPPVITQQATAELRNEIL